MKSMDSIIGNRFPNLINAKKRMNNSKLFKIDDISLNIYLDGFDVPDFLKISKLIKMYGGTLSAPNAETVVLSAPDYSVGTDYLRFHVNWLYDSIEKNELQDIGKYILPSTTDEDCEPVPVGKSINDENGGKMKQEHCETKKRVNKRVNTVPMETEPPRLTSELRECKIRIRDIKDQPPQLDRMDNSGVTSSSTKKLDDVKLVKVIQQSKKSSHRKERKRRSNAGKKIKLYSKREDQKIVQYLIEHSAISEARGMKIWRDMEAAGILPNRSPVGLKLRFARYLKKDIRKYVNNAEILAKIEDLNVAVK